MFKLALSYIIKMKKNTIVCLSGLIVSIILLFSLVQIGYMIMDSYQSMMTSNSNYDITISNLNFDQLEEINSTFENTYEMSGVIFAADYQESNTVNHYIVGVEGNWLKTFSVTMVNGRSPSKAGDIVIEERYAKSHGLKTGDALENVTLSGDMGECKAEFKVCGIISDTPSYTNGTYMFICLDEAKSILEKNELYEENPAYTSYFLIDEHGYPEDEIYYVYSYIFKNYDKNVYTNFVENPTKYDLYYNDSGIFSGINSAVKAVAGFVSIIMVIFIYYMMHINLQGKYKQYGIIRAIGAKKSQIASLIGCELMIYIIISLVIGCIGGIIFNNFFAKKIIAILLGKEVAINNALNYKIIIYMILIITVPSLLVWFIFIIKLRNKNPIDLIQKKEVFANKKFINAKNIYIDLIVNNSYRNRKNSRALIITMFLASLMTILFINGASSVSFNINKSIYAFSNCEVTISLANLDYTYFPEEQLDEISSEINCMYKQSILKSYHDQLSVKKDNEEMKNYTLIVYSDDMMKKLIDINKLDNDCHIVTFGDEVSGCKELVVSIDGKEYKINVDGNVSNEYPSLRGIMTNNYEGAVIVDESYARENLGFAGQWNDIFIDGDITSQELTDILGEDNFEYYDLNAAVSQSQSQMQSILVLLAYMAVSIILLSIFLIRSIVKESFEHRKKEIGMICAIGTRKNQMTLILVGETLLLVVLATIISSIISIPISMYVYEIMNSESGLPWQGFGIGIPLIMLLSGLVIWMNVKGCMKEKIAYLLKCEE